jgi:hypothetical protein
MNVRNWVYLMRASPVAVKYDVLLQISLSTTCERKHNNVRRFVASTARNAVTTRIRKYSSRTYDIYRNMYSRIYMYASLCDTVLQRLYPNSPQFEAP